MDSTSAPDEGEQSPDPKPQSQALSQSQQQPEESGMSSGTLTPESSGSEKDEVMGDAGDVGSGETHEQEQEDASKSVVDGENKNQNNTNISKCDGDGDDDTEKPAEEQKADDTPENRDEEMKEAGEVNPPSPPPPPKSIVYDPDGDLILIINPDDSHDDRTQCHLRVASKLLSFTSPVWKDMISNASAASTSPETGSLTISPDDGDYHSLNIFLKIIHFQFSSLPAAITFQQLYKLAIFSEKYAVYETLRPFARGWIEPFLKEELDPERVEWVRIAWEFGLLRTFLAWVDHLCGETQRDADGKILYRGREVPELFPEVYRETLVGYVEKTRTTLISALLSFCKRRFEDTLCHRFADAKKRVNRHREQCDMLKNGYLMAGLNSLLGNWNRSFSDDSSSSISLSARELKEGILNMEFEQLPVVREGVGQEDHSDCGLVILKYEVMQYRVGRGFGDLTLPTKTFGRRCDGEAGMLPSLKRHGFRRTDLIEELDELDGESEGDGEYLDSTCGDRWEPEEEYESEGFEEDSDSDGGEEIENDRKSKEG